MVHRTVHGLSCYMNIPHIQNYLYKLSGKCLSGKRLSGKVIVPETSCMEIIDESGHADVRETSFRETSCPGK